ncbi:Chitin synthase, class 3 [Quaeritorhiza haematococci]|nr:Chitin synthase, class 3 [Quaeritorhiza haematococci]
MIQVFEYYISHHLSKAFESVFGGVTCLPGCFSLYRIKAPKGNFGYYVPILANPDIVEEYSENVVDTLHKKNLLLLGEDRYLSTLMLRTFPRRKMMFVPQAICKTVVPDTFKVLLSQRRRWINSTIHNLLELLLVRDLCGTFCISMQFVVFMELIGTVVLPAAITFTIYLIIVAPLTDPVPVIPLTLLAAILGLPALLIVLTAHKLIYVFWMLIYILALPVWNFILPLYAFWHFDDFSWGETRKAAGDAKGEDHGRRQGEFDGRGIVMKRWMEWMRERRIEAERAQLERLRKQGVTPTPVPVSVPVGVPVPVGAASVVGSVGSTVGSVMMQRGSMVVPPPPPGMMPPGMMGTMGTMPPPPPGMFIPPPPMAHMQGMQGMQGMSTTGPGFVPMVPPIPVPFPPPPPGSSVGSVTSGSHMSFMMGPPPHTTMGMGPGGMVGVPVPVPMPPGMHPGNAPRMSFVQPGTMGPGPGVMMVRVGSPPPQQHQGMQQQQQQQPQQGQQ